MVFLDTGIFGLSFFKTLIPASPNTQAYLNPDPTYPVSY